MSLSGVLVHDLGSQCHRPSVALFQHEVTTLLTEHHFTPYPSSKNSFPYLHGVAHRLYSY